MLNYNNITEFVFIVCDLEWLQITPVACNIFRNSLSNRHRIKTKVVFNNELHLGASEQELFTGYLQIAVLEPHKTLAQLLVLKESAGKTN